MALPDHLEISAVVLADEIEGLDWKARQAQVAATAPEQLTAEVLGKLNALLS